MLGGEDDGTGAVVEREGGEVAVDDGAAAVFFHIEGRK